MPTAIFHAGDFDFPALLLGNPPQFVGISGQIHAYSCLIRRNSNARNKIKIFKISRISS